MYGMYCMPLKLHMMHAFLGTKITDKLCMRVCSDNIVITNDMPLI